MPRALHRVSLKTYPAELALPHGQSVREPTQAKRSTQKSGQSDEVLFRQLSISTMYGQGQDRDLLMNSDGSHKHDELGSARSSYLAATYELRDAELALQRATIADYDGASDHLVTVTALHRAAEVRLDSARAHHTKAWITFDETQ